MYFHGELYLLGADVRWRDPENELPEDNEIIWAMLEPHKNRGSLLKSAPSIQIVCGWASVHGDECSIENADELGWGSVSWKLKSKEYYGGDTRAIAWVPLEEMTLPSEEKEK